jgi:hypothetical protein
MILRRKGRLLGQLGIALGVGIAAAVGWGRVAGLADRQALKNTSLTSVRQEALTLFPRGSRLDEATSHLTGIGFDCEPMTHFLPDISAPSLLCASNGRGYPNFPAVNLTVITRNGLIADIEVWNVMARADSDVDDIDMMATGSIRPVPTPRR